MSHFGIVSPPVLGHLRPLAALGRELIRRGHFVTVFQMPDRREFVERAGLTWRPVGESDHPKGSLPVSLATLGRLRGLPALRFTIEAIRRTTDMFCRDLPGAVESAGVDALIVDQTELAGGTVAEALGIPFVNISCALTLNREPSVPPPFTGWKGRSGWFASMRNLAGYWFYDRLTAPIVDVVGQYRRAWGLPRHSSPDEAYSRLAQISQLVPELDFPRRRLPTNFVYAGPLTDCHGDNDYPFHEGDLDGRPLVYASLGTLQGNNVSLFGSIAEAATEFGVQLVIAHGGGLTAAQAAALPGRPLVYPFVSQAKYLSRASLAVTHGGMNTVIEATAAGVPMVVVPITFDQPAIAERVRRSGAGLVLRPHQISASRLRSAMARILQQVTFRDAARRLSVSCREAGGVSRAAGVIERAVSGSPSATCDIDTTSLGSPGDSRVANR